MFIFNCDIADISLLSQFAQVQFIMPRGYRKYKSRRSSGSKGFRNNEISNLSSVILNPFSNVSTIPRIPDGLATYSTGFREQVTDSLTLNTVKYILLYPGLTRPFLCYSDFNNVQSNADLTLGIESAQRTIKTQERAFSVSMSNVESIRIVSQGLSLKCTSNSQNNDGYFEAIRFNSNSLSVESVNVQSMANNPSYVHGKIRDLDSYTFQLKPSQISTFKDPNWMRNDLIQTNSDEQVDPTAGAMQEGADGDEVAAPAPPGTQVVTTPADANNLNDIPCALDFCDSSWDSILIKLVPTNFQNSTSVFLHTVTNFELVYDESSEMAKFMTTAPKDLNAWERCKSVLTSNMKACRSIYHAR